MPNFENILAEADKDAQAALGSLHSPRDTRAQYMPTGRTYLDCLLPCTADAASQICHRLQNHPVFYGLLVIVDAGLFVELLSLLAEIPVCHYQPFTSDLCQLSSSLTYIDNQPVHVKWLLRLRFDFDSTTTKNEHVHFSSCRDA